MDFLKEVGIDQKIINKICENNDQVFIFNFICNKEEVIKNIKFLKYIGIKNIEKILIYKLNFLIINNEKMKDYFNNQDINNLVNLINEDINATNLL